MKYIVLLVLVILSFNLNAQNVRATRLKVDSVAQIPSDTLLSAPNNSIAVVSGSVYYKDGVWKRIIAGLTNVPEIPEPEDPEEELPFTFISLANEGTNEIKRLLFLPEGGITAVEEDGFIVITGATFGLTDDANSEDGVNRDFDARYGRFSINDASQVRFTTSSLPEEENADSYFNMDPYSAGFEVQANGFRPEIYISADTSSGLKPFINIQMAGTNEFSESNYSRILMHYDSIFLLHEYAPTTSTLSGYNIVLRDTITGALVYYTGAGGTGEGMENPMTTSGDMIWMNGSTAARLPIGTTGQILTSVVGEPTWVTWITPTWQETLISGSVFTQTNDINLDSYSLIFRNSGLFRILDTTAGQGGIYDFNEGVDLFQYNSDTSYSILMDIFNGVQFLANKTGVNNSFKINIDGIFTTGLEFSDIPSLRGIAIDTLTGKWFTVPLGGGGGGSGDNFANANLTQTADRTYDGNGYAVDMVDLSSFSIQSLSNYRSGNFVLNTDGSSSIYFLGHADSLGTIIKSGLYGYDQYATLFSTYDGDSAYIKMMGHLGLRLYGGTGGIYEIMNVPTYDGAGGQGLVLDGDRIYKTNFESEVILESDVASSASTSAQNITGLSFPVVANERYYWEAKIMYVASDPTIGLTLGVNGPSVTYTSFSGLIPQTATGLSQFTRGDWSMAAGANATPNGLATATIYGWVQPSSSGTVQLRFSPETATASGITIKAGSFVKYAKKYTFVP